MSINNINQSLLSIAVLCEDIARMANKMREISGQTQCKSRPFCESNDFANLMNQATSSMSK